MKFKSLLAATALICASSSASAISSFEGKIEQLLSGPLNGNNLSIRVDRSTGSIVDPLANCDNPQYDYFIDMSTESGQFYASMLLTAFTANQTVIIQGLDVCQGGVESVRYILLKK